MFISKIIDHGCWCAKFNPESLPFGLGGSTTVDELDSICKQWAHSRWCTHVENFGVCQGYTRDMELNYTITSFNDINDSFCPDQDSCLSQTCQIDTWFIKQLMNWLVNNEMTQFDPITNPVCSFGGGMGDGSRRLDFCKAMTTTINIEEISRD